MIFMRVERSRTAKPAPEGGSRSHDGLKKFGLEDGLDSETAPLIPTFLFLAHAGTDDLWSAAAKATQ
jgi:hypothetical protein